MPPVDVLWSTSGVDEDQASQLRPIRIDGDTVTRPAQVWTPTVHCFLRHLLATGLSGVPEPLGIDGDIERLRFLPGESGGDGWYHQHSDVGLRSAARLLRRVHDASRGWEPPAGAVWGCPPGRGTVVCHGDPGPWNFIWDGDDAVGLVDWDFAHPGDPIEDVAYALKWFAPLRPDDLALSWHHFPEVPDRRHRVAVFLDEYGDVGDLDLVDAVVASTESTMAHERSLAEAGVEPQRTWVAEGHLDDMAAELAWLRANRHLVD